MKQMEDLHQQCQNEVKTVKQDLRRVHEEKENDFKQKLDESYLDLQKEEEKLLQTIDALNHSNEQGDTL